MRFQRITAALDAVRANAGISLCGLALILDLVADGGIRLPYPPSTGIWSQHGFCARFRLDASAKPHVSRFRAWLRAEGRRTAEALDQASVSVA